jgi:hypothetical protein
MIRDGRLFWTDIKKSCVHNFVWWTVSQVFSTRKSIIRLYNDKMRFGLVEREIHNHHDFFWECCMTTITRVLEQVLTSKTSLQLPVVLVQVVLSSLQPDQGTWHFLLIKHKYLYQCSEPILYVRSTKNTTSK